VKVSIVKEYKESVLLHFKQQESEGNKKKLIEKIAISELTHMLEADAELYSMKKGQTNVVMFVGLQGSGKTTSITKYA